MWTSAVLHDTASVDVDNFLLYFFEFLLIFFLLSFFTVASEGCQALPPSVNQQKYIVALGAEKDSLIESNRAKKKAMFDWKQQLFSKATSNSALLPLAKLKVIYNEPPSFATQYSLSIKFLDVDNP